VSKSSISRVSAEARHTDREQIRARIHDGIQREQGGLIRLRADPLPIQTELPASLAGDPEAIELERDVEELHRHHQLYVGGGAPKRLLVRPVIKWFRKLSNAALRPMLEHQSSYNGALARSVSALRNQGIRHELLMIDLHESLNEHARTIGEQTNALLDIERTARTLERDLSPLRPRKLDLDQLALANAFRGTEASVKDRQTRYIARFAGADPVVDLGCGRGEFLELLRASNVEARGIDLDTEMVEHCRAKGLTVEQRDALEYLSGLPDNSLGGIFAAQVVEHLPAFDLVRLVREACRTLQPSGALVIESVNPESLMTFAEFYIDPTHVRPYHPQAISWLFEQAGFSAVEVELSVDPEPDRPLPPLAAAGITAPAFDDALTHLNTLVYGRRAYAVTGLAPPAQP